MPCLNKTESFLHCLAGIVLLLFAASHFAFLGIRDPSQDFHNTVFPILTNWRVFFLAAVFELLTGFVCLTQRDSAMVNAVILTFVGIMCWYRWAFYYTGGTNCGCLGFLARLLHLSKTQEKVIPVVTLLFLVLTTLPWAYRHLRQLGLKFVQRMPLIATMLFAYSASSGELRIEIQGDVDMQDYNPGTGIPYPKQASHSSFRVILSGPALSLCITNKERRDWWAQFVYDGTNSYTLQPPGGSFGDTNSLPETDTIAASIEPSPRLMSREPDPIALHMLWYTYALSRKAISTNKAGVVAVPLAGSLPRENPGAYGYRWDIDFSDDGRFPRSFEVIRDQTLDLSSEKEEMLRPELDYPETLGSYNEYLSNLQHRRSLPSGWVKARFSCVDWYRTNGVIIPIGSICEAHLYSTKPPIRPWREIKLTATDVVSRDSTESLVPQITAATHVTDYRYKRANESRIFAFAEYDLRPGEHWKAGDDLSLLETEVQEFCQ